MHTIYLTLEQILVIHEDQIERYGGTSGLRNLSLLESATFRPQSTFDGNDLYTNPFEKAAALMHSLISNHPFIDGNKRTGFVSAVIFLEMNGWTIHLKKEELVQTVIEIALKKFSIEEIALWLKKSSTKTT